MTDTVLRPQTIEGVDLDADLPCATVRCHDAPNPADYLVRLVGAFADDIADHAWLCCDECYRVGQDAAYAAGIGPAFYIVEVLR